MGHRSILSLDASFAHRARVSPAVTTHGNAKAHGGASAVRLPPRRDVA
jgi:hypothetical protein